MNGVMSETEYLKQLTFCAEHGIACFEFHRRYTDWKEKFRKAREENKKERVN